MLHSFFEDKRVSKGKGELFNINFEDFIQLMPQLVFDGSYPLGATVEENINMFVDMLLASHWEATTGLPFELWQNYTQASTSEGKERANLSIQSALNALSFRQYLIETCSGITENEIQECLEAAATML